MSFVRGVASGVAVGLARGVGRASASTGLTDAQILALLDVDQMLGSDSLAHYTTAEWPGYEHLIKDQKTGVGTLRTPRAGRCWLFDGTDDYATRADSNLKPTGDFTITLWIKTDWTATDDGIVGAWSTTGYMLFRDSGVLRCYRDTNYAASSLNLNTAGYSNTWIHLAVVANGTSCKFYVNGSQFGTTQTFPTSTQAANGAVPFFIGAYGGPQGCIAGSIRDVRLYGTAKSDSEIAAIANQASTPGTYDTTSLLGAWWCEEESGTTGYDWSGNGRHLTLTNITQSTFHASDTGVTYSDANHRGYKASGSVVIPAINSTTAADSTALTYTGRCPQPGHVPQKCVTGNGTDVTLTGENSSIEDVTVFVKLADTANQTIVYQEGPSSSIFALRIASNLWNILARTSAGVLINAQGWTPTTGAWQKIRVRVTKAVSGSVEMWINDVQTPLLFSTGNLSGSYSATTTLFLSQGALFSSASLSNIAITTAGVVTYYPLCEGAGSGSNRDIHYVKSNGTSGVLSASIAGGTVGTIWSNATDYTSCVFNWPIRYGFTLNGSGVVVPARMDGSADAAGNAIGQAAGAWASGLQNVNTMPYTNPLGVNIGLETSLDPTADRKTASSSKRRRKNNSGRYTRFGARATAMSDANSNSYFGD